MKLQKLDPRHDFYVEKIKSQRPKFTFFGLRTVALDDEGMTALAHLSCEATRQCEIVGFYVREIEKLIAITPLEANGERSHKEMMLDSAVFRLHQIISLLGMINNSIVIYSVETSTNGLRYFFTESIRWRDVDLLLKELEYVFQATLPEVCERF
jgi:hypothetical protein